MATTNSFYNHTSGYPASLTRGASAQIREEFDLIKRGFDEVETMTPGGGSSIPTQVGNSGKVLTTDGSTASWSSVVNGIAMSGTGSSFGISSGKSFSVWSSLAMNGTDGTTMTFPSVNSLIPGLGVSNTFTSLQTFGGGLNISLGGATITGVVVVNNGAIINSNLDVVGTSSFSVPVTQASGGTGRSAINATANQLIIDGTLPGNPSSALQPATKQYVDSLAGGATFHAAVDAITSAALAACTYANGTAGVGATLTENANGALGTIGGYASLIVGNRVLVKDQASALQNGIYTVTSLGSAGSVWVLTRATDFNTADAGEVVTGAFTYVTNGTVAGTQWGLTTIGAITIGTTSLAFSQMSGASTVTSGNSGISVTGNVVSNSGVLGITVGTNISNTGTAANPILNVSGVVSTASTANGLNVANAYTGASFNGITALSSTAGAALAVSAATGVATTAARADHAHPLPSAATLGVPSGSGTSSGTNTGDNAANSTYSGDYRVSNFVDGSNYVSPTSLNNNTLNASVLSVLVGPIVTTGAHLQITNGTLASPAVNITFGHFSTTVFNTHTNSTSRITKAPLNDSLQPASRFVLEVGAAEVNAPTTIYAQCTSTEPVTSGATNEMVGISVYASGNNSDTVGTPSGKRQRPVWGGNFSVKQGPLNGGLPPTDCAGIEVDVTNQCIDSTTDINAHGHTYGFWSQCVGPFINGSSFITTQTSPAGWVYGYHASCNFSDNAIYVKNLTNAPRAKGIYVETTYASNLGTIAEFAAGGVVKFKIDGATGTDTGVWMRIGGTGIGDMRQIEYGAPDSAGTGYRVLRILN